MARDDAAGVELDVATAEFITGVTSMSIATRDARLMPAVGKASGCIVSADRRSLTVLFDGQQSPRIAADLASGSPVAVVFSLAPVAVALGRVVLTRRSEPAQYLLGAVLLGLLLLVPVLGPAVALTSSPLGLGAWWMAGHPPVDRALSSADPSPPASAAPDH